LYNALLWAAFEFKVTPPDARFGCTDKGGLMVTPRNKQLAPEMAQQNSSMQQALKITGYPTVWLLYAVKNESNNSFNLNTIGTLGYPQGAEEGKEQFKFLENANAVMAKIKAN
jgi:hypothetical protein